MLRRLPLLYWSRCYALCMMILLSPSTYADSAASIIIQFEQCKTSTYRDSGGHRTIGYGFKNHKSSRMTCQQAQRILHQKIADIHSDIITMIKVPLTEGQKAAVISLVYNIGTEAFRNSRLLKRINSGQLTASKSHWISWSTVKGRSCKGLKKRRNYEWNLMNGHDIKP